MGAVSFRAWVPQRSPTEEHRYHVLAMDFSKDVMDAIPKYLPSLQSARETSSANACFGKNGTAYVSRPGVSGSGASSSVIKVVETKTKQVFGAKVPHYSIHDDHDKARSRFEDLQAEYEHITQFDHPYILKAFELVTAEDPKLPPWMIVEYIPFDLEKAMADLGASEIPIILTHLASALHHMHALGITHRDVKPANVLVQRDEDRRLTVKLADFGSSRQNASHMMDSFHGTPIYMAPELFMTPRRYTHMVDMWALGLIGVQLLTSWRITSDMGKWQANDFGPWMRDVVMKRVAQAPEAYRPLLKGLLRRRPATRWSSGRCLKWLWRQAFDGNMANGSSSARLENDRKRPASSDGQTTVINDRHRYKRSAAPSISTTRANEIDMPARQQSEAPLPLAAIAILSQRSGTGEESAKDKSTVVDAPSPGIWRSDTDSPAPTPRVDEGSFDSYGGREDEEDESDDESENEW